MTDEAKTTLTITEISAIIDRAWNKGFETGEEVGYKKGLFEARREAHREMMRLIEDVCPNPLKG